MNIALLITGLGMGGAERQVVDLADRFAAFNHTILIIYLTGEAVVLPSNPSIRVISMGMTKTPWSFLITYRRIRSLLQSFKPDVLHSHMVHANIMARLLRLFTKIPRLICTAHNTNEGGVLRMLAYRVTDSLCDLSTNVSQEAVDSFIAKKAVPYNKIITMYNGIDMNRFQFNSIARKALRNAGNIGENDTLLLCVGRLNEQKDYFNMLRAFALCAHEKEGIYLWIAGIGEMKSILIQTAEDLGISEKVSFLGLRHDIPELMSACDLFCLSSAYEGFGLVVAEAMACERLVVATDCGGVKEVIGENGILVSPRNDKDLSQGIHNAFLRIEKSFYQGEGMKCRDRISKNFSLETITEKWLDLYKTKAYA